MEEVEAQTEERVQRQKMGSEGYAEKRRQLETDYSSYKDPGQVKKDAIDIYLSVVPTTLKRGKRKAMMWKCLYEAYKKNNIPKDPILLAKTCGVEKKQLEKAQTTFESYVFEAGIASKFPRVHFTAQQLLPDIAQSFGVEMEAEQ